MEYVLCNRIEEALKRKKINQKKLSEITGIPKSSINQLVKGRNKRTKAETIEKIAKALNVRSAWLKGETEIEKQIITGDEALKIRQSSGIDKVTDEEIISRELKFIKYEYCSEINKMLDEEDINTDLSCLVKYFKEIMTIDEADYNLLRMYNKLNDEGKKKCDQFVNDMGKIGDYTK